MSQQEHERFGHDKAPFETREAYLQRLARGLAPYLRQEMARLARAEGYREARKQGQQGARPRPGKGAGDDAAARP